MLISSLRRRQRQGGVAVVTALLITALAVTLVTDLFWQQQVALHGLEGQRLRLETRQTLRSALDGAMLVLRDAGAVQGRVTTLDGAWARGGGGGGGGDGGGGGGGDAGSSVGSGGRGSAEDGGRDEVDADAQIVQHTADAQARLNLRGLVKNDIVDPFALAGFERMLATLHVNTSLARTAAQALLPAAGGVLTRCDDLAALPGFTPAVMDRLRPFIVLLPEATAVNVNTADAEVLTAVATLTLPQARQLVQARAQAYFKDNSDFALRLNDAQTLEGVRFDVTSEYFLVASEVRLKGTRLRTEALVRRSAATTLLWVRES